MREARRLFAAAKRRNRVVPTLTPPASRQAVFGLTEGDEAAEEAPNPTAPAASASPL